MVGNCLKRLATGAGGALTLVFLLLPLSVQAAAGPVESSNVGPAPSPAQAAAWQAADKEGAAITAVAAVLGPYLVRHSDGTLSLNAPPAVIQQLPAKYVGALNAGLLAVNARVVAGQLQTTPAGAVFDPRSDGLTFQGGWTGSGSDWWHSWYCLNHNDVVRMENVGWWTLGTGALIVLGLLSTVLGAAVGIVVYTYGGWMMVDDKGNGSCLNFGHFPPPNIWVTSQ
jgi:hypothetical protein